MPGGRCAAGTGTRLRGSSSSPCRHRPPSTRDAWNEQQAAALRERRGTAERGRRRGDRRGEKREERERREIAAEKESQSKRSRDKSEEPRCDLHRVLRVAGVLVEIVLEHLTNAAPPALSLSIQPDLTTMWPFDQRVGAPGGEEGGAAALIPAPLSPNGRATKMLAGLLDGIAFSPAS